MSLCLCVCMCYINLILNTYYIPITILDILHKSLYLPMCPMKWSYYTILLKRKLRLEEAKRLV